MKSILIDPGHGGSQPGACHFGVKEKFLNEVVASLVYTKAIPFENFEVQITRTKDITLPLSERLPKKEHCCLISIHHNSFPKANVNGFTIFSNIPGEKLAKTIKANVLAHIDSKDMGISIDRKLYLLKKTDKPSIIVECGFMSNKDELFKMCHPWFQCAIAEGIINGISTYVDQIE